MSVLCAYLCPGAPGDPGIDGPEHSEGDRGPAGAPGDTGVTGPPGKTLTLVHILSSQIKVHKQELCNCKVSFNVS